MLCERPSRRSGAEELHFCTLAQPGCVFLEVPHGGVDGANNKSFPEVLVARARTLVPLLAECAAQAEAELKVADEVIAALQEAQLFRVMQPKRHGGFEFGPKVFAEIQQTLAEGCMSTAWMYGVVAVHPWQLALFPEQAQQEVWGAYAVTLIASTGMPEVRVTEVEGGYRIGGRWGFSSGCETATGCSSAATLDLQRRDAAAMAALSRSPPCDSGGM